MAFMLFGDSVVVRRDGKIREMKIRQDHDSRTLVSGFGFLEPRL